MKYTSNKAYMRFENMAEINKYFPNNDFTVDKKQFISRQTKQQITSFPVYMMLRYNGPDAASLGLGEEYRIIDVNEIKAMKNELIATLNEINHILT